MDVIKPDKADRIKHLEMIQAVISRMTSNSFFLKGWSVTLVAAIVALAAKDANQWFLIVALLPVLAFWSLDAYYLHLERLFRELYKDALCDFDPSTTSQVPIFSMSIAGYPRDKKKYLNGFRHWLSCLKRGSVLAVHGTTFIVTVALIVVAICSK